MIEATEAKRGPGRPRKERDVSDAAQEFIDALSSLPPAIEQRINSGMNINYQMTVKELIQHVETFKRYA